MFFDMAGFLLNVHQTKTPPQVHAQACNTIVFMIPVYKENNGSNNRHIPEQKAEDMSSWSSPQVLYPADFKTSSENMTQKDALVMQWR